jgi:UDP-hydrolysing UDP-N-acetyl-D-glucosamine 2-epimerase
MKVLAVSGTRADWGLIRPVLRALHEKSGVELKLAVTGQILAPGSDMESVIASDGFAIDYRIDMGLAQDDSARAIGMAMGRCLSGTAEVLAADRPDLMLVLGDRYEILAVVSAALVACVPVAHIAGGDVTEGAFDDAIRHAITKLASLHFVTNAEAQARVIQLGEDPNRVFLTGSPGVDSILEVPRLSREVLFESLGLPPAARLVFLITYHPATLSEDSKAQCSALLRALDRFPEAYVIFTGSNADPGARQIESLIQEWVARHEKAVFHTSLGSQRYLSALAEVDAVIGNSSSGLYEAPSYGVPTVNIGNRQARRPRAASVIDCAADDGAIIAAISRALAMELQESVQNPYGDGRAAPRIAEILSSLKEPSSLVQKSFKDVLR